uniref:Large ribosomal subunit protein uL18 n=1 Tax=candidate division WOR-3 bacterium TaxID=2052148 RepID=A0A7V4E4P7_UNCW3
MKQLTPLEKRHLRIRKKIFGTTERPRLLVKRSNKHIYAYLINDELGRMITGVASTKKEFQEKMKELGITKKTQIAYELGKWLAEKAKSLGIEKVVFDRGGYKYHGRVKAVAEGAREGGLKF